MARAGLLAVGLVRVNPSPVLDQTVLKVDDVSRIFRYIDSASI